jgi:signal transduction histidine kinase
MALSIRRKKYFVDQGLQLRFARFVIIFVFLSSILTGVTIFFTTFMMLGEKLAAVYPQGRLVEIFRSVYISFFVDMLIVMPVIFAGSIIFSHRIAGPLPKIYQTLKQIGSGSFEQRLVLRKHDELKELADVINQMSADLKERETKK